MRRFLPVFMPVILLLAACGWTRSRRRGRPIVVRSESQEQMHQLDDMNRAIALRRALHESASCRRVTKSGYVGRTSITCYGRRPGGQVRCSRDWALFVGADESVQVRLCRTWPRRGFRPRHKATRSAEAHRRLAH